VRYAAVASLQPSTHLLELGLIPSQGSGKEVGRIKDEEIENTGEDD